MNKINISSPFRHNAPIIILTHDYTSLSDSDELESDEEEEEEVSPKYIGNSVADLAKADITPSTMRKPGNGTSWVWKSVALTADRLRSAEAENKCRAELDEPLPSPQNCTTPPCRSVVLRSLLR